MSSCLRSLLVRPVERDELDEFKALLRAHHWLGYCMSGPPMRYLAELDGAWVALATFGSAVLRCPVREDHIGWSPRQRADNLEHVVANQRFCVLPAGPAELLDHSRNHWDIEVQHNIRDVTFKEDSPKIRTGAAPQVLATIRNIGIFILEPAGHKNKAAGLRDLASHTFNLRALDLLGL